MSTIGCANRNNMKIGYISVQRDGTGYAHQANEMIQCLSAAGHDVVSIWTTLSRYPHRETPDEVTKLENKKLDDIDVVIQHTLPQYFTRLGGVRNIGIFQYETDSFRGSNWQYSCNLLDEIWTFHKECVEACVKSGVEVPVREIDAPHNFHNYTTDLTPLIPELHNKRYIFYTISEMSYRKNIPGLLMSYLTEFSIHDNVLLIVKCFIDNRSPKETEQEFIHLLNDLKGRIKKGGVGNFPPVVVLTDWLTEKQMLRLHNQCNCFVTASRGESECIPLFDAAMMGNQCIAANWGGPSKILFGVPSCTIPYSYKQVMGMENTISRLYMSDERWAEPNLCILSDAMRKAYEDKTASIPNQKYIRERFSYETIGKALTKILENNYESSLLCL